MLVENQGIITSPEQKEVITGASYTDDVYYSFENGIVATVQRDNWDLGFTTTNFKVSILANSGAGVEVYTYTSGDTTDSYGLHIAT